MTAQQVDEVDSAYVRDRALDSVVANLAPAPFLLLPFVVLISTLLRTETSSQRIGWWLIAAVLATLVGMLALQRYRIQRSAGVTRVTRGLVTAAFFAIGAVFGLCPWVGADSRLSVVLLYTIFPATASAVGCIVAAGRRDMYLAFLVPLVGLSAYSLAISGSSHLRGLAALSVFYGAGLVVLHHVVSRSVLDAIRLQWRSEQLVVDLDHERQELTVVNQELESTNLRLTHQATHDPLTGLFNRRGTLEFLEHVLATVSASTGRTAVHRPRPLQGRERRARSSRRRSLHHHHRRPSAAQPRTRCGRGTNGR